MNTITVDGMTRDQWITTHRDQERIDAAVSELRGTPDREYVDPCPGMKGTDRITKCCGKCDGTGVYDAPSSCSWNRRTADGIIVGNTWCFACNGAGTYTVLVSSERAKAHRSVREDNKRAAALRNDAVATATQREDARLAPLWEAAAESVAEDQAAAAYTEGERFVALDASVARIFTVDGLYGESLGVVFDDGHGVELTWFTTAKVAYTLAKGDLTPMGGVVKSVGTYRGKPSVKITRCKIDNIGPAPEPAESVYGEDFGCMGM